jgi:hypothetical protein
MATQFSAKTDPTRPGPELENGLAPHLWHRSAPEGLRRAARSGDAAAVWAAWREHLVVRKEPVALSELLPAGRSSLRWNLPDEVAQPGAPDLLDLLQRLSAGGGNGDRTLEERSERWIVGAAMDDLDAGGAIEALAWCHALPPLAGVLSADAWWNLLTHLSATAIAAGQLVPEDTPLVHQLLAGELCLSLAYVLPELTPCRKLVHDARVALSAGLSDVLDGEGLPYADHLGLLRPLLACWTRCQAIGRRWKKGCFGGEVGEQFSWTVRQALRWTRPDGTQVLGAGSAAAWCEELFAAALRFDSDEDDHVIAAIVLPGGKKARAGGVAKRTLPESAAHSEWAAAAVLRPRWTDRAAQLSVLYPDRTVRTEFCSDREVLWSGEWRCEIRRNGQVLSPESDWEEVCWVSDEDVDYLELEIKLADGVAVQRQMLLAREDRFLLLADAVLGDEPGKLEYRGWLPLGPQVAWEQSRQTREGFLVAEGKPAALVLPLALPEWRADGRGGTFEWTKEGLQLTQAAQGHSMYAPLFIDLHPRRMTRRLTWRKLTVAESLETQPDDVAVGYRVQIGKEQWLIYRSLVEPANRTLLGHNLSTEALVARFDRTGEVEPLVEVE